ncbi:sodium:calcium antiporter [Geomesophilobacter sediminis]|uniref:Sodium:calcium antiporter n=1 Tax=Geomesophilobacter sediminis TaxID=2798584 RepID=A0A8J7LXU8_9BACT|nr:sodium:calcium antiporter [Geomesophilobacter sediminis]MBJ6723772.1 sodium:calcium antiporter [Geomesophilobacter sediminis]
MWDILMLLLALGIILLGATVFTNGLEWFGKKLNLSDGAVGSVFAAVGTALPETLVPLIAILFGPKETGASIGVGAIIGAPFMLGTLAMFISGAAVMLNRKKRPDYPVLRVDTAVMRRDIEYFLALYGLAIVCTLLSHPVLKVFIALTLLFCYAGYVLQTLKGNNVPVEEADLDPCYFAPGSHDPRFSIILTQVLCSLLLIVWGAHIFVEKVQIISLRSGISAFVLSMIIAPIATELPEKFNSVIWINRGKDTLAIGNVTGAMVFQSSVITAIGIMMTPWKLSPLAFMTVFLTFASVVIAYAQIRIKNRLTPGTLLVGGVFYVVFLSQVFLGKY